MGENEFDKLFNRYFGDRHKRHQDSMNEMLNLMNKLNSGIFNSVNDAEAELGEPNSVREFEKDGILYEESTWTTELGTIIKISTKENVEFGKDFFNKNNIPLGHKHKTVNKKEISLEDQLKMAVKDENYEKAAELRDLIAKKDKKDLASENLDNKGFPDKDEWNF